MTPFFKHTVLFLLGFVPLFSYSQTKKTSAQPKAPSAPALSQKSAAKPDDHVMGIMAKGYEDAVALRWAPTNYTNWEHGKKLGYHVYRQEMVDGKKIGAEIQLTITPVRPVSEQEFKRYADTSEVAKKALFAIGSDTTRDASIQEAMKKKEGRNFGFTMSLVMANVYPLVARLSGMAYTDKTVEKGKTYYYEVRVADPVIGKKVNAWAYVTVGKQAPLPKPFSFTGKSIKRNAVLQWRTDFILFNYAYFDVYRSEDPETGFQKVNKLPYVGFVNRGEDTKTTKFQDTLPRIDKSYYYKIVGIDPFGDAGPWSETILIKAKQSIYFSPVITRAHSPNNKTVAIEWEHPKEDQKNILGYVIQRTDDPTQKRANLNKTLLSASTHSYEDKSPLAAGYYRVVTVGIADDSTYSLNYMVQLVDSLPPATPSDLIGTGDTNGVVTLRWKQNKEEDFYGYRVFRTFGRKDEYTRLTDFLKDTVFHDTISKKLGYKKAIYTLVALDGHFNPSKFSAPLEVKFPDLTPPGAPELTLYEVKPHAVRLNWMRSLSLDAIEHTLYRKGNLDYDWVKIASIPKGSKLDSLRQYTDTSAKPKMEYLYAMQATDDYGLKSPFSNIFKITALGDPYQPAITEWQAFVGTANNMIKLAWQYNLPGVDNFVIYRKSKEGKMQVLQTLPGTAREYYDKKVTPNSEYSYYIVANFIDWSHSKMSNALTVKY